MRPQNRRGLTDPMHPDGSAVDCTHNTPHERARARLIAMLAGHDPADRLQLLQALGLDQTDEAHAQLAHRHERTAA